MIAKVCGLTRETDLAALCRLARVRYAGLIFVEASPRYVGVEPFARPRGSGVPGIEWVGVFRDQPLSHVLGVAQRWNLRGVQLHGTEDPAYAASVRAAGYLTLKAIGVRSAGDLRAASAYAGAVDYLLFDTPGGGTGRTFDWSRLAAYTGQTPFLLAGGIGPGSGPRLAELSHGRLAGVDLNSRFERAPGNKDLAALKTFLQDELPR